MVASSTGASGRPIAPTPPPRLPVEELIRRADIEFEARARGYATPEQAEAASKSMHLVTIFPHQDPGTRVREEEFLRTLDGLVAELCGP